MQSGFVSVLLISRITNHKLQIRSIIKSGLRNGRYDESLVAFSEEQLKDVEWEDDKEFFLGDDKYDVVRVEYRKGHKVFYCINDKMEKELFAGLNKSASQEKELEHALKELCVFMQPPWTMTFQNGDLSQAHGGYLIDRYAYMFSGTHFRPPTPAAHI